ncbi:unnamed protein product [Euphydryas editha]|uniref:KxDL motif-containing protein 1 n=1 Tax=Euphydryas editha TaxID=104508 RepID=A0AAU9TFQ6_EUPED|nr:unnamed protein product [Euphydryas editha]
MNEFACENLYIKIGGTFLNKRKLNAENEEFKTEFSDMKLSFVELRKQMTALQLKISEMMTFFTSSNTMQMDNFFKIREDILVIKYQVSNIKSSTECLNEE